MPLLAPDAGEVELLDKMLKDALSVNEDYSLRLFTNNYTPVESSVLGDFTEPTFVGYAPVTLTRASWAGASTSMGVTSTQYATQSWTKGDAGSVDIYGYFVIGATSNVVLWAERFAVSPRTLANGDTLNLTPRVELA